MRTDSIEMDCERHKPELVGTEQSRGLCTCRDVLAVSGESARVLPAQVGAARVTALNNHFALSSVTRVCFSRSG